VPDVPLLTCTLLLSAGVVQAYDQVTKKKYVKEFGQLQGADVAKKAIQGQLKKTQDELEAARKEIQALK
jgi:hypothetical protein